MAGLRIAQGEWVIICDGAKSLLLENKGDAKFPNLVTLSVREQENPSTAEQGVEPPGRVHASAGTARSAYEQTDWHDQQEEEFLAALAKDLNHAVEQGQCKALVIVAPPRALGMLRPHYSKQLQGVLRDEVAKDYAGKPVHEIEKLLTA